MHKTCCNNRPRKRVDMNLMAWRPRMPLTNPYFFSLAKQLRLCPLCDQPTLLNGLERSANGAMEACDNPDCTYFKAVAVPDWGRTRFELPNDASTCDREE